MRFIIMSTRFQESRRQIKIAGAYKILSRSFIKLDFLKKNPYRPVKAVSR